MRCISSHISSRVVHQWASVSMVVWGINTVFLVPTPRQDRQRPKACKRCCAGGRSGICFNRKSDIESATDAAFASPRSAPQVHRAIHPPCGLLRKTIRIKLGSASVQLFLRGWRRDMIHQFNQLDQQRIIGGLLIFKIYKDLDIL